MKIDLLRRRTRKVGRPRRLGNPLALDLSGELPGPRAEVVSDEDLSRSMPSEVAGARVVNVLEESTLGFGGAQLTSKSIPGGMSNRASGLTQVVGVAVIAGLATAGVCKMGEMSGNVLTGVGLGTMLGMVILGLIWITRRKPKAG
ncbi:hypothetical protein [Streptomyces chartreusis]|uniref:hypothetical protein n=1 Tax=Streptomyces chartreusis TaxID=1969 RepID=UPI0036367615